MTQTSDVPAVTFRLKLLPNTVQVSGDDTLITVRRFDVCGDQVTCIEAVDVAVNALREAAREVVRQSWRYHNLREALDRTNGFHA